TGPHAQHQKGRRGSEANGIAEAVQLHAEGAGGFGEAGHVTIQGVEYHRADDEPAAQRKVIVSLVDGLGLANFTGHRDGREAADGIPQGEQGGNNSNSFHGTHTSLMVPGVDGGNPQEHYEDSRNGSKSKKDTRIRWIT